MDLHLLHTGPLAVNTYIVPLCGNKVFIVDPADCAFCGDEGFILSHLKDQKLEPQALLLTHGHFDHVSGLPFLKKAFPELPIAIHKADGAYIGPDSAIKQKSSLYQMGVEQFLPAVSNLPSANAFLEDNKTLDQVFADCNFSQDVKEAFSKWQVLHTPGHTPGCCCFYNKIEETLISGDTLFYRSWGRTDLEGGSEKQIQESLLRLKKICPDETKIYPGHEFSGFTMEDNF
ncbi:MAG: MBL fold metallo-hydrolase [Treponema sp.]|nr:MBL fold metallo-hydrolase [Treponema sp.]